MENTTAGAVPVVEFRARALAPVALFKSEADIRFYLNGICVQPGPDGVGCYVIGCDGHRLALWYDAAGKCSRRVVLRVTRELVSASRKKGAKDSRVVLDGGRLVIAGCQEYFVQAGKAEIELGTVGAGDFRHKQDYPNVFNVIPKQSELQPGALCPINGAYFEDIGKASKLINGGAKFGYAVWHFTKANTGPMVTRFEGEENFLVVTMPMRSDGFERWSMLPVSMRSAAIDLSTSAPATLLHPMGSMGEAV